MSSAKKVRVTTGLEDDDDRSTGGFSASSSISGSLLVGTGQGAPTLCELTAKHCRARIFGGKDGLVSFICAKPETCGSKGHEAGRAPTIRGSVGHYKVASVKSPPANLSEFSPTA